MLSSVLKSDKAIQINIQVVCAFTKMRHMLNDNTELRLAIEEMRKKTDNSTKNIELVFQYLDELLDKNKTPEQREIMGYKKGK